MGSEMCIRDRVYGASVGEMVAGVVSDGTDDKALENRERVMETMHQARYAIEQRLALEQSSNNNGGGSTVSSVVDESVTKEATAILTNLKSIMWDNVGVVRTPSKLALAVSELSAMRDEADRLWNSGGGAGWEVVALRDAAYSGLAVAESALANRVSGGAHYVVLEESESENKSSNIGSGSKSDSDDEEPLHAVI